MFKVFSIVRFRESLEIQYYSMGPTAMIRSTWSETITTMYHTLISWPWSYCTSSRLQLFPLGIHHTDHLTQSFISISHCNNLSMARSYRRSFIETSGGVHNIFAHKIFCCWDFGISNKKSADLKHQTIFNDLQETLNEFYHTPEEPTKLQSMYIILGQITAHALVFVMLAGLGVGMWAALNVIKKNISAFL